MLYRKRHPSKNGNGCSNLLPGYWYYNCCWSVNWPNYGYEFDCKNIMSEWLTDDPYGIGIIGYTREWAESIINHAPPADFSCIHRGAVTRRPDCELCVVVESAQPMSSHAPCTVNAPSMRTEFGMPGPRPQKSRFAFRAMTGWGFSQRFNIT